MIFAARGPDLAEGGRMKALVLVAALAGCVETDATTKVGRSLPTDVHYVVLPAGYSSPEECIETAEQPFSCIYSMSLCKGGKAGLRSGDILEEGRYELVESTAGITFDDGRTMDFDVDTVTEPDSPGLNWVVDTQDRWETLQFDNISCD
jgi:hypothetical protein